jgi:chromosome segregation ATPase
MHPSLVLVNDEILSTQVRLMELYLKQAEAMAANEAARAQERFQTELTALQEELKQKEIALETQQALSHRADQNLRAEVQELRARLLATQCSLHVRQTELDFARSDAQVLQQRIAQSESTVQKAYASIEIEVARARETWQEELSALEAQLERKESALQLLQASVKEVEGRLRAEVLDLRSQLAAKAELLKTRADELQNAQRETALLRRHVQQFALTGAQTEAAASEAIRIRETLQAELASLRTAFEQKDASLQQNQTATRELEERLSAQLHDLQNQLTEKDGLLEARSQEIGELSAKTNDLQEKITCLELANKQTVKEAKAAARAIEDSLRVRVQELEATVSEKAQLLQNRATELESTQSDTALLRQRIQQLELTGAQSEAAASEAIRIRETLQAELVVLRTAVEQKDLSLQQNHAATRELEDRLTTQLRDLHGELAEKQGLLETRSQEIGELSAKTNDLQEQITCLELANKQTVKEAKAAARELEDSLRARVQELEATVSEKAQGLQNRTVELESAQSETALLRQRIQQLELTGAQTEEAKNEADRRREALQNELDNVHRALEQKDRSFAQQEAEFKESDELLHAQLQNLQSQLIEREQLLAAKDGDLAHAAGQIAGLEECITQLESLHAQTQTAAATEVARLRHESQSEAVALQTSLREKEQALQQHQAAIAELEASLNGQIQDLRNQLTQKQELLDRRDQEFQAIDAETVILRERIAQLESAAAHAERFAAAEAERIRGELQAELAGLQAQLKEKKREVAGSQALLRESESRWQAQIHDLQIQIAEKQLLLETHNVEIVGLQNKLTAVSEQLAQFEAGQHEATTAVSNAENARQRFEAELAARQEELRNLERRLANREAQSHDLQKTFTAQLGNLQGELAEKQVLLAARGREIGELTAKTNDLQGQITCLELTNKQTVKEAKAAARAIEDSLRARVQELEATVSEKAHGLQNRTVELESAQSETALLRQRIQQLELTGAQTEEAKNEADRRREALQNELDNVHRALEQKDRSFAQQEAEFRESNELLHAQLRNLQSQLAEERALLENQKREIHSARSEITALRDRVHELESAKAATETNALAGIERFREQYQLELVGLRAELAQSQLVLDERQTTIRALHEELNGEIHRLEAQLAEKQSLLDRGHLELQEKGSEISALREEIIQSKFARRQTEMLAATQADQIRERVKAEVGALDTQLKEKESALKVAADRARELESAFNAKIADLQMQLAEKQSLMQGRDIELTDLRSQISNLLAQVNDLERTNAEALEQQRVGASRLEQDFRLQVTELQTQLTEKLAVLGTRNDEIRALESKISGLLERIGQAEVALKQAEATATNEIGQIRRQSQAEFAAQQAESDRKAEGLQQREVALYSAEQNHQLEINGLRAEVAEKHSLLQSRNDELLRVKTELDTFQERIAYLEAVAKEAKRESPDKPEHTGEYARTTLDTLWEELSQKEQILDERRVAVNDLEQGFQAQIDNLRGELAEKQALLEIPNKGFLPGEPTLTEIQKEKLNRLEQLVETIKADNEQTLISSHNRRWRFSLGRKRRWKS